MNMVWEWHFTSEKGFPSKSVDLQRTLAGTLQELRHLLYGPFQEMYYLSTSRSLRESPIAERRITWDFLLGLVLLLGPKHPFLKELSRLSSHEASEKLLYLEILTRQEPHSDCILLTLLWVRDSHVTPLTSVRYAILLEGLRISTDYGVIPPLELMQRNWYPARLSESLLGFNSLA